MAIVVFCADGVLHCDTLQGLVLEDFLGVNKVVVGPLVHVAEYDPNVKPNTVACTDVPECASMSLAVVDRFTVMQVGTVGVAADEESHTGDGEDARTVVQHAALVLVTAADGAPQRCEVLTAQQLGRGLDQVAWRHSGQPTMDIRQVTHKWRHEKSIVCHETRFVRHEIRVLRHENDVAVMN